MDWLERSLNRVATTTARTVKDCILSNEWTSMGDESSSWRYYVNFRHCLARKESTKAKLRGLCEGGARGQVGTGTHDLLLGSSVMIV